MTRSFNNNVVKSMEFTSWRLAGWGHQLRSVSFSSHHISSLVASHLVSSRLFRAIHFLTLSFQQHSRAAANSAVRCVLLFSLPFFALPLSQRPSFLCAALPLAMFRRLCLHLLCASVLCLLLVLFLCMRTHSMEIPFQLQFLLLRCLAWLLQKTHRSG